MKFIHMRESSKRSQKMDIIKKYRYISDFSVHKETYLSIAFPMKFLQSPRVSDASVCQLNGELVQLGIMDTLQ